MPVDCLRVALHLGRVVGFLGIERVVSWFILKGEVSGPSTRSDWEGVSDSLYSSSSELRDIGSSSSSSSSYAKLLDSLTNSSAFRFVRSSVPLRTSWLTDPGVDRLPGRFVLRLPVAGVVRVSGPLATHVFKEAISSVLISGIASYNMGSNLSAGGVTSSGLG